MAAFYIAEALILKVVASVYAIPSCTGMCFDKVNKSIVDHIMGVLSYIDG